MASNYREPNIIFEGWTDKPGTGIIVTGAASGIGAATAILAAQHGLKVAAWDMFVEGVQAVSYTHLYSLRIRKIIFHAGSNTERSKSINHNDNPGSVF